ncbi:unnamed protein product [Euphydryas editha]|uniref:Uncharacterized protein n=1 Tax=Euphydryas editha TaxID=104508 RepID=A0AAU9UDT2_EUPED|nr:unnamed protein product [Euphydryas editha]
MSLNSFMQQNIVIKCCLPVSNITREIHTSDSRKLLPTRFEVETTTEHAANLKSSQSPAPIAVSAQFPVELMVCQYCSPPLLLVVQTGNKTAMPSRGGFMRNGHFIYFSCKSFFLIHCYHPYFKVDMNTNWVDISILKAFQISITLYSTTGYMKR